MKVKEGKREVKKKVEWMRIEIGNWDEKMKERRTGINKMEEMKKKDKNMWWKKEWSRREARRKEGREKQYIKTIKEKDNKKKHNNHKIR
jgi:hypothetical protein